MASFYDYSDIFLNSTLAKSISNCSLIDNDSIFTINNPMIYAAQYIRMSSDIQRYSLENQSLIISNYARKEGYEIVRTYEDSGRSGVNISKRNGLRQLLKDVVSEPPFSTILVVDVSRWGRYQDPDEAAHYEFICRDAGVKIEYCGEPFFDDGSPTSALMKNLKRVMAAEYSRQLSDRCRAGLRRTALSGARTGGAPPYGFARQAFNLDGSPGPMLGLGERRPRPDQQVRIVWGSPAEVSVVRRIFHLFVNDLKSPPEISRILNSDKIPYNRDGPWDHQRVRRVLMNELATGVFAFNRSTWRFGAPIAEIPPEDWQRIRVADPIVSIRTFAKAHTRIRERHGHKFSDADLIEKLRRILKQHGYLSRKLIEQTANSHNTTTYIHRFGSMVAAYKLAGYEKLSRQGEHLEPHGFSINEIENGLRIVMTQHGYLTGELIDQCPTLPHSSTLIRRHGSLLNVYRLVGYSPTRSDLSLAAWSRRRIRLGLKS